MTMTNKKPLKYPFRLESPMQHAQLVERVRQIVRKTFAERGLTSFDDFCETILIREGLYCGRCFACGDFRAVWFLEENAIKFFCRNLGLLCTLSAVSDSPDARSLAA
jgi:hypothetical protein